MANTAQKSRSIRELVDERTDEYLDSFISRFWDKVDRSDDCWEWNASKSSGYGHIGWTKPNGKREVLKAHRVSTFIHRNGIEIDGQVNHTCHNKACVNPDHLYVGTSVDNNEDYRDDPDNELKVSLEEADEIRKMYDNTSKTQAEVGEQFGVSQVYVSDIVRGENR